MMDVILGLALALPAQAPAPAAPQLDVLKAQHQAILRATAIRRRAAAQARAASARHARAERLALHMAQLEYQARVAPYVAEQQSRQAQHAAEAQSEQAWLQLARQRNLIYAYGFGVPVTGGAGGVQVYDGLGRR